jgi:Na+/melibiose symporter-like transporter
MSNTATTNVKTHSPRVQSVAIVTITKIFDAASDPLVGSIIDRTHTRWGKLRPFVLFSAAPVAILTGLLFSVPNTTEPLKLVFFGVCYLLWGVAYSACDVPLWGLIGSAFGERAARNRVVSNVGAFGAIALGLATLGMTPFALALSFSSRTTAGGWSRAVFIAAIAGMELYLLGFGRFIVQAGGAVFVVIAHGNPEYFTLIGEAIIAGPVLASFTTPILLKRMAGKTLVVWSSVAGAVLYFGMYLAGFHNLIAVVVFIFLTGLTLGVFLVVQATCIADSVDDVEARTGVHITPQIQQTVWVSITVVPAISCLVPAVPFLFYRPGGGYR